MPPSYPVHLIDSWAVIRCSQTSSALNIDGKFYSWCHKCHFIGVLHGVCAFIQGLKKESTLEEATHASKEDYFIILEGRYMVNHLEEEPYFVVPFLEDCCKTNTIIMLSLTCIMELVDWEHYCSPFLKYFHDFSWSRKGISTSYCYS